MDDFCGTVSSWKHYIMTNWVTPQGGGHVCDRQNSQRESNAHTFIFISLMSFSAVSFSNYLFSVCSYWYFCTVFSHFTPFFCSCRLAVITSFLMSFPPHLFCLYLLYIWFPLSPFFTLLGTKTPTSPPPSFFSLFLLPPPFHIHRLPTALLSLPPLVLPSTRVPLLMLLAVYLCVSV